jgi:hypothetical protein
MEQSDLLKIHSLIGSQLIYDDLLLLIFHWGQRICIVVAGFGQLHYSPTQQAWPMVILWSERGKEVFISGSFNN